MKHTSSRIVVLAFVVAGLRGFVEERFMVEGCAVMVGLFDGERFVVG